MTKSRVELMVERLQDMQAASPDIIASAIVSVDGLIIASALVLNYLVADQNIPSMVAAYIAQLEVSPFAFLLIVNGLILLLGCLFDATTLLLIVVPLFLPAAHALGIDPVHFGVLITLNIMIGLITPPYGVLLFVLSGVTGIPLSDIIDEIWPFILVLLLTLGCLILLPSVTLWLPRMFGYGT